MGAILTAYSLSGAAGVRSSPAILVVALLVHFHRLTPPASLDWVGSAWFICLALVAATVEFFGDKIPVLDHALHAVHFVLAPVAGGIAAMSGYHGDAGVDAILGVLGAANALMIHSAKSGLRAVSSATTLGGANPFLSLAEDVAAAFFIFIALLVPAVTAVMLVLATVWAFRKVSRTIAARRHGTA